MKRLFVTCRLSLRIIFFEILVLNCVAHAQADDGYDASIFHGSFLEALGSAVIVNPGTSFGLEGGAALLFAPNASRAVFVGPRVQLLYAPSPSRFDVSIGAEANLWIANAVDTGLAMDFIPISTANGTSANADLSFELFSGLRLMHMPKASPTGYNEAGAVGSRLGVFYDTHYQWGVRAGVTIQWSGVPHIGYDE